MKIIFNFHGPPPWNTGFPLNIDQKYTSRAKNTSNCDKISPFGANFILKSNISRRTSIMKFRNNLTKFHKNCLISQKIERIWEKSDKNSLIYPKFSPNGLNLVKNWWYKLENKNNLSTTHRENKSKIHLQQQIFARMGKYLSENILKIAQ